MPISEELDKSMVPEGEETLYKYYPNVREPELTDYGLEQSDPVLNEALQTREVEDLANLSDQYDLALNANQDLLEGKIPQDVQNMIEIRAAEKAMKSGTGTGQAGRYLTARDLGLTSMDLKTQGIANLSNIAQGQMAVGKSMESIRQFNKEYDRLSANFLDTAKKTSISRAALDQEWAQFRVKSALALNEQVINLASFREELQKSYYLGKAQGSFGVAETPLKTIDNLLDQLSQLK